MKLRIILIIAGLFFAGCWYTTLPEDSNPENCRKQTYGFLIFHTSSTSCEQASPTATPTTSP